MWDLKPTPGEADGVQVKFADSVRKNVTEEWFGPFIVVISIPVTTNKLKSYKTAIFNFVFY